MAAMYELRVERERASVIPTAEVRESLVLMFRQIQDYFMPLSAAVATAYPDVSAELQEDLDHRVKEILDELNENNIVRSMIEATS